MTSAPRISIDTVSKAKSTYCVVTTLASAGDELWVNGRLGLYEVEGEALKEVRTKGDFKEWNRGLLATSGGLVACGGAGVARSTDRGVTFVPYKLPTKEQPMYAIALDANGTLWAGGETYEGEGLVVHGDASGRSLAAARGKVGRVWVMATSRLGVLIGDRDGRLWLGRKGALEPLGLNAGAWIRAIHETAAGTILVLAGAEEDGDKELFRSTDAGRSFTKVTCKRLGRAIAWTLAEVPGGPVIAGASGELYASSDDGQSFVKVSHPGKSDHAFATACVRGEALLVGGPFQPILAIEASAKKSVAAPKPKAPPPPPPRARSTKGYVGSGKFKAALEAVLGPLAARKAKKPPPSLDLQLDLLPAPLADEVHALYSLFATHVVPPLSGLREGGYCTIPSQFEMDADDVREEEWFSRDKDIAFVMRALEIFNDGGNPFILVAKEGVFVFYDDPHGYKLIADDLTSFLQVLVALESARKGKSSLAAARKALEAKIHPHAGKDRYATFFRRALADERSGSVAPEARGKKATKPAAKAASSSKSSAKVRRFECREGGSNKFWEITLEGSSFTTRFGKIGADGQSSTKSFATPAQALAEHERLVREKTKKGYEER